MQTLLMHQKSDAVSEDASRLFCSIDTLDQMAWVFALDPLGQKVVFCGDSVGMRCVKLENKIDQLIRQFGKLMPNCECFADLLENCRVFHYGINQPRVSLAIVKHDAVVLNLENLVGQEVEAQSKDASRPGLLSLFCLSSLAYKNGSGYCCSHQDRKDASNCLEPIRILHRLCRGRAAPAIEKCPRNKNPEAYAKRADDEAVSSVNRLSHDQPHSPDVMSWSLGRSPSKREPV